MGFSNGSIWEVQTGGDDTNFGGGFDSAVGGFATDLTCTANTGNTATPEVSTVSYTFLSADVGAWLFVKAGTNWIPGFYKITSVSGGKATLDAAIGKGLLYTSTSNVGPIIGVSTAVGVATVGTPTSGTWGVDYSQSTTARYSSSTFSIDSVSNNIIRDSTNTVGKNWIGNIISITGGTGFTVQRVVVASTGSGTLTLDKSAGTLSSSGGVGKLGGALATPGLLGALWVNGNMAFVKSGTYVLSTTTANASGGPINFAAFGSNTVQTIIGYNSTRFDLGTPPVIQVPNSGTVTGVTVFSINGANTPSGLIANITIDGQLQTTIKGFDGGGRRILFFKCTAKNCTNNGFNNCLTSFCWATGCTTTGAGFNAPSTGTAYCVATGNSLPGFVFTAQAAAFGCIAANNSGASSDGFQFSDSTDLFVNCSAYGNGRDGFRNANGSGAVDPATCFGCVSEGNAGKGFGTSQAGNLILFNCTENGNGAADAVTRYFGLIQTVATVFQNAAANNFALAMTASGRQAKSAALPGQATVDGLSASFQDIGAVQARWPMLAPAGGRGIFG